MIDDLQRLADDLAVMGRNVDDVVAPVVKRAAQNIKDQARATVAQSHTNKGKLAAGRHINYDLADRGLSAQIGYDAPAGNLGNFNEFGSVNNTPDWALNGALTLEAERIGKHLGDAVGRLWRR